jgi:hypothetical protein
MLIRGGSDHLRRMRSQNICQARNMIIVMVR